MVHRAAGAGNTEADLAAFMHDTYDAVTVMH